jgi:cytochrome c peroxidase
MRIISRQPATLALIGALTSVALLAACGDQGGPKPAATATQKPIGAPATATTAAKPAAKAEIDPDRLALYKALPEVMESTENPVTPEKVALGQMLYFEKRLSKNHDISCNSCHDLAKFGVDGKDVSDGHKGQKGTRNSPSVYNAALHAMQFWDGRAKDVEEQAGMPITNPGEMAMKDEKAAVDTLKSMPEYEEAFKKAFPDDKDAVSYANLKKAIGAFERKLVTPSRWDKFLKGDKAALTDDEKRGFNAFWDAGCQTCHAGVGVGGALMQKLGSVKEWPNQKDQGKFEVTKSDSDKMLFKAQSLRNVEKTAPYFHDASGKTLEEATKMMAEHQLGKKLGDDDVKLIVAWMKALTGELPADLIKEPKLPESTKTTPKPDAG